MILPGLKWKTWAHVRARSLEIHREAIAWTNQNCVRMLNPNDQDAEFVVAEDEWLTESADILGMTLEDFGQAASRGQIEWRENYGHGYEIRHDGQVFPMRTRPVKASDRQTYPDP